MLRSELLLTAAPFAFTGHDLAPRQRRPHHHRLTDHPDGTFLFTDSKSGLVSYGLNQLGTRVTVINICGIRHSGARAFYVEKVVTEPDGEIKITHEWMDSNNTPASTPRCGSLTIWSPIAASTLVPDCGRLMALTLVAVTSCVRVTALSP